MGQQLLFPFRKIHLGGSQELHLPDQWLRQRSRPGRRRGVPAHRGSHESDGHQRGGHVLHLEGHLGHPPLRQHGLQAREKL